MNKGPRKQHYVPRFYLEGFVAPDLEKEGKKMLWVYEAGREAWKSSPENTGYEVYHYAYAPGEKAPLDIEKQLQKLEDIHAPLIRRIREGDFSLSERDRAEIAGFLALSIVRVPFFRLAVNKVVADAVLDQARRVAKQPGTFEEMIQQYQGRTDQKISDDPAKVREWLLSDRVRVEQRSRGWNFRMMFEVGLPFLRMIQRMHWTVVYSADDDWLFLTSDRPVCVHDPAPPGPRSAEPFSKEVQITCPMGRRVLLFCGWHPADPISSATPYWVREFNKREIMYAYKYIYTPRFGKGLQNLIDRMHGAKK